MLTQSAELIKTAFSQKLTLQGLEHIRKLTEGVANLKNTGPAIKSLYSSTPKALRNMYSSMWNPQENTGRIRSGLRSFKQTLSNNLTDNQANALRGTKTLAAYTGPPALGAMAGASAKKKSDLAAQQELERIQQIQNYYNNLPHDY